MSIELAYQIESNATPLPTETEITHWVRSALPPHITDAELTLRVVDTEESAALNLAYRHKKGPTNVLSFPYEPFIDAQNPLRGDLVICAPLVAEEAALHQKTLMAHWAHLVVHGILHLLGYDHQTHEEAEMMESLETDIIVQLGFLPPYGDK